MPKCAPMLRLVAGYETTRTASSSHARTRGRGGPAERGVNLEVPDRPGVEAAIAATAPRRLDVIDDSGRPVRRVRVQPREHILRVMWGHMAEESRRA